jgi:hypothetical protein
MKIRLTRPMQNAMTPELMWRIERTVQEFPELEAQTLTVGRVLTSKVHGSADSRNMVIRLNTRQRSGMTFFTIAHELTHLLQKPGLGTVPNGEIQCDIFALARSSLFVDDMPTYLPGLRCGKREWKRHATAVRDLCIKAIEIREARRTYIAWLSHAIREYFEHPALDSAGSL